MIKNIGKADRVFRLFTGGLLALMALTPSINGWPETVIYLIAAYLIVSALIGHCVFNRMLDIDSHLHAGTYHSGDDPFDGRGGN